MTHYYLFLSQIKIELDPIWVGLGTYALLTAVGAGAARADGVGAAPPGALPSNAFRVRFILWARDRALDPPGGCDILILFCFSLNVYGFCIFTKKKLSLLTPKKYLEYFLVKKNGASFWI